MKLTRLKALALQAQVSNRTSNQSLTEPERVSNFPSNFQAMNGQKFDNKFDTNDEQKKLVPTLYLGMSTKQIIATQRLRFYWS
ncbi:uncharacterized protein METZ01_LOCUS496727, partial [marine metagenome]